MTPLVVLDDGTMEATVLRNQTVLNEFPFLKQASEAVKAVATCAQCQRSAKGQAAKLAISEAKRTIANMPPAQKERFRQLLGARRVRVFWTDASGQRTRADF